jgi:hypothetical protein
MLDTSSVLWTLGILATIEALACLIFPKWCLSLFKKLAKWKIEKLRSVAWLELLIAIIILIIAINL